MSVLPPPPRPDERVKERLSRRDPKLVIVYHYNVTFFNANARPSALKEKLLADGFEWARVDRNTIARWLKDIRRA